MGRGRGGRAVGVVSTVWDRAVAVLRMHIVSYVTIDGDAVCRCGWQHLERLHPTHLCHVLRADGLLRTDPEGTETEVGAESLWPAHEDNRSPE